MSDTMTHKTIAYVRHHITGIINKAEEPLDAVHVASSGVLDFLTHAFTCWEAVRWNYQKVRIACCEPMHDKPSKRR